MDERAWYLVTLSVGIVLAAWAGYLWFEIPVIYGQSTQILLTFIFFGIALLLWLFQESGQPAHGLLSAFLALMSMAWVIHLLLYRYHGDAFNYTALLYVPILLMVWLKPPRSSGAWQAIDGFSWTVVIMLVGTRILEMIDVVAVKSQPEGVIEFDANAYFLPFNDILGIEGRWPGPFGHNGDTAMMGALLVVIGCARWRPASWVFVGIGASALLLTDGRASVGAMVAGLLVLFIWSRSRRLTGIHRRLRCIIAGVVLIAGATFMYFRPAGLTGRQTFWPAFLELWWSSPIVGVGGQGIAQGNDISRLYLHAHSLYIDELARWGLAGFLSQFIAIGFAVVLAARAASRGSPGPLAVIVVYLIAGITEPRNNWISPSVTGFLLVLMALTAAAFLRDSGVSGRNSMEGDFAASTQASQFPKSSE